MRIFMKWHKQLYVGDGIGSHADKVKWKIRHNAGQCSVYVITLASNPQNLLDIIPSRELLQKSYPKSQLYVLGLAKGYEEAVETAARIVLEVYKNTGGFALREYFM